MQRDESEPSLGVTLFPIWLAAVPVVWILIADYGSPVQLLAGYGVWLLVCWGVISTLTTRNARQMTGWDGVKSAFLMFAPYVLLGWYLLYFVPTYG